jgi:hypothetical protein
MKYFLGLIGIIVLCHTSCNKSDASFTPTLPAITQTGANTFGCYVDGVLVTPRNGKTSVLGPSRGMIFWAGPATQEIPYHEIDVTDFKSGTGGLLNIHIINLDENGEGTFTINESNCAGNVDSPISLNIYCRLWDAQSQTNKWYCSKENSGELLISRYDYENRIVSGTFECLAVNQEDPSDSIEISQGRFDIKWDVLNTTIIDFP